MTQAAPTRWVPRADISILTPISQSPAHRLSSGQVSKLPCRLVSFFSVGLVPTGALDKGEGGQAGETALGCS